MTCTTGLCGELDFLLSLQPSLHMSFTQFFVFEKKIVFELSYPGLQHKLLKTEMEMVEFRQRYIQEKSRRMTLHNTLVVSNCATTVSSTY